MSALIKISKPGSPANTYYGKINAVVETESFKISISNHQAKSTISTHAHSKSYMCLSVLGDYNEKSHAEDIVTQGDVIFRNSGHEHANSFFDKDGVCLNIEFNNEVQLMTENAIQLPDAATKQKSSIDFYKVLFGFKNSVANDLLNIYCHEAMLTFFKESNKGDLAWIKQVKDRIDDAPLENISLALLSAEFGLHPNYITRKFKEVTGLKLSDYLAQTRLRFSLENLIGSEQNLTEIALQNGFYDQSHFNRNFKKHFATTPFHFKKIVKG